MSEEEARGIGALLRRAREKKGWSTQDVSSRLRLMSRQIDAIEKEEFSRLGPPVFARGFVRNYAKLLGMNPDELLDQMTRIRTTAVPEKEDVPFKPNPEWWRSPIVLGGIAVVFLLIFVPVVVYFSLGGGEDEEKTPAPAATEQISVPPPAPPLAPQAEPQSQAAAPNASQSQSAVPQAPAAQKTTTAPRLPLPFPVPAASAPAQPSTAQQAAAPAKTAGPRLQFDDASWVQIRDSSGMIVHSGLNPAGSTVEVNGKAPFYLVIGNAENVRLNYKGQTIDLKPYTAINVARLTLN